MNAVRILSFLCFVATPCLGASGVADVVENDPGLFIFMIMMLFAFLGVLLLGMVLMVLLGLAIALVVGAGITSVAALGGLYYRSVKTGILLFVYLSFVSAGAFAGFALCFTYNLIWPKDYLLLHLLMAGMPAGALAGWATAKIGVSFFFSLLKRLGRSTAAPNN